MNSSSPADAQASERRGGANAPAPDSPYWRTVRSFVKRAGRTTGAQARAFVELGPRYLVPYRPDTIDLVALFAESTRAEGQKEHSNLSVVLEVGFGMGEATAQIAAALPQTRFLCCEVHEPGVGALLKRIGDLDLRNVRICAHDAVEVIDHMLPQQSLDGVHVFFPDPWHKTKHHKRRLIQGAFVTKLARRLKPGGYLHSATDWEPYAAQMLQVLEAEPLLENLARAQHPELQGFAPRPAYRPPTKFERRGLRLGHGVWDLVLVRRQQG